MYTFLTFPVISVLTFYPELLSLLSQAKQLHSSYLKVLLSKPRLTTVGLIAIAAACHDQRQPAPATRGSTFFRAPHRWIARSWQWQPSDGILYGRKTSLFGSSRNFRE